MGNNLGDILRILFLNNQFKLNDNVLTDAQALTIGFLSGLENKDLSDDLAQCTSNNDEIINTIKNTIFELKNFGLISIPNIINDLS